MHEVRNVGFTFPLFVDVDTLPPVSLPLTPNGYVLRTRAALVSILTNPAYIGWYCFNGVVASTEAHESIVDMDTFLYAYTRLSDTTLQGEVNESKPKQNRNYGMDCNALLEGILESNGNAVYCITHDQSYTVRIDDANGWEKSALTAKIASVDTALDKAIPVLLSVLERRHRQGLQDSLYAQLKALQAEKAEEVSTLTDGLETIEKGIREWELAKKVALQLEYEPDVIEAVKQLKALHESKRFLLTRSEQVEREKKEIAEYQELSIDALERWESFSFERKRRYVRLLVDTANITEVAPHVIKLEIQTNAPVSCMLHGYIYRYKGSRTAWLEEENNILREMYMSADRAMILQALPTRTWKSCITQALELGLNRATRLNTSDIDDNVSYADVQLMERVRLKQGGESVWTIDAREMIAMFKGVIPPLTSNIKDRGKLLSRKLY